MGQNSNLITPNLNSDLLIPVLIIGFINLLLLTLLLMNLPEPFWKSFRQLRSVYLRRTGTFGLSFLGSQTFQILKGRGFRWIPPKVTGHAVRAACTGMAFITATGLFMGRVLPHVGSLPWTYLAIMAILATVFLLLLERQYRKVLKYPPLQFSKALFPLILSAALTLLSFSVGFAFAGYCWHFLGQVPLSQARRDVLAAGYHPDMPPNDPSVLDSENAITYLQKSLEVPSANSLFNAVLGPPIPDYTKPYYQDKNQLDFITKFFMDMTNEKATPGEIAAMRKLLKTHGETLRLVEDAYGKKIDWKIDFQKEPTADSPVSFKNVQCIFLGKLLDCQAYLEARQGLRREAMKNLRRALFLGDVSRRKRDMIGQMIDAGIFNDSLNTFHAIFPYVDESTAQKDLYPGFKVEERQADFKMSLEIELFVRKHFFLDVGWLNFAVGNNFLGLGFLGGLIYWPFLPFDVASSYESHIYFFKDKDQKNSPYLPEREKNKWLMEAYSEPRYSQMIAYNKNAAVYAHMANVAYAAKRFYAEKKQWPKEVQELKGNPENYGDPFNGGEGLKIAPYGRGIVIYCWSPFVADWEKLDKLPDFSRGLERYLPAWILY